MTFQSKFLTLFAAVLMSLSFSHFSASADETNSPTPEQCDLTTSVVVHVAMEYQDGLAAWTPAGKWDLCFKNGAPNSLNIEFRGEPFKANFTIVGNSISNVAQSEWTFDITRQDTVNDQPYGTARFGHLVVSPGYSSRLQLNGWYKSQTRNLRINISI